MQAQKQAGTIKADATDAATKSSGDLGNQPPCRQRLTLLSVVMATSAVPTAAKPKVDVIWKVGDTIILSRAPPTGDVRFWNAAGTPTGGYMTVVPMVFGSALCMIIFFRVADVTAALMRH